VGKHKFRIITFVLFMLVFIFSFSAYAVTYESSSITELENIILKELNLTNSDFNITYSGGKEEIDKTMNNILKKDHISDVP